MKKFSFILFGLFLLLGCEKEISSSPHEIHWDRDMCKRCAMMVSDREHAAQIINPKNGKSYPFDDLGCAIIWLNESKVDWKKEAVLWVIDSFNGEWIDAKKALYTSGNITPMAYGFKAYKKKQGRDVIGFAEVKKEILKRNM